MDGAIEQMTRKKCDLGKKDPCPNMLIVPSKCVVSLVCSQRLSISLNVVEVSRVPGSLVQPSGTPQQLILQ